MKQILLAILVLIGSIASAAAACTSPAVMHDFPGTSFNMSLATVPDGNCGSNVAVPTWGGGTLGAMANYGTSPGAVLVPGMNAFITNVPTVAQATAANLNATIVGTGTFAAQVNGFTSWAGGTLGAMANYGTSPGAVLVPGINAFVTNTNANGQATAANSSPVVEPVLTNGGAAVVKGGVGVVNGGNFYETVAASQTATVLQSSAGAAGDYLSHCVIYPASTSPGVVTVFDSTNTAANSAILFAGGATSTSNLAPIPVPVGAISVNGAWKVTTGANVSVVCYGKFS